MQDNPSEKSALCVRSLSSECSFRCVVRMSHHVEDNLLLVYTRMMFRFQVAVELKKKVFLQEVLLQYLKNIEIDISTDSISCKSREMSDDLHQEDFKN